MFKLLEYAKNYHECRNVLDRLSDIASSDRGEEYVTEQMMVYFHGECNIFSQNFFAGVDLSVHNEFLEYTMEANENMSVDDEFEINLKQYVQIKRDRLERLSGSGYERICSAK